MLHLFNYGQRVYEFLVVAENTDLPCAHSFFAIATMKYHFKNGEWNELKLLLFVANGCTHNFESSSGYNLQIHCVRCLEDTLEWVSCHFPIYHFAKSATSLQSEI